MIGTTLTLLALLAPNPAPRQFVFAPEPGPEHGYIQYFFDHDLHDIRGKSKAIEAKLLAWPDGKIQLMVRASVVSFKSGDANRDVHAQEVMEAAQYPYVIFKAAARLPAQPPATGSWPLELKGQLDFHGRKKIETLTLEAQLTKDGALVVTGSFVVSLEKYEVERPSLLFVTLHDDCLVDFKLKLVEKTE